MALRLRIEYKGDDIKEVPKRLRSVAFPKFMDKAKEFIWSRLMTYTPVNQDPERPEGPHLYERFSFRRVGNANIYRLDITNDAPYALFAEVDTKAHFIFPVRASVLHWRRGGEDFFARYVLHPGTTGQKYMSKTQKDFEEVEPQLWSQVWEEEFGDKT